VGNHSIVLAQLILLQVCIVKTFPFNPKYPEWYSPSLDHEHTIQVCRGERVKCGYYTLWTNVWI